MPRNERVGKRSGIGAGAIGGHKHPRSRVEMTESPSGRFAKSCSPHEAGQRYRRSMGRRRR